MKLINKRKLKYLNEFYEYWYNSVTLSINVFTIQREDKVEDYVVSHSIALLNAF